MDLVGEKVLVTGGAGFIGSHLVESLLRLGSSVTVYDNFDDFYPGKEANLASVRANPKFTLVKGSILDYDGLSAATKGKKIVFHLAAQAGIRYCNGNPRKANDVNATGTLNVLLASRENGVKKMVNASSSSVYGNAVRVPIGEEHPLYPTSAYGASKLAGEKYCYSFFRTYDFPVTSLRYFSVYGPRGRPDQVLYSFANNVSEGKPPVIYGDGHQSRDFTYISDIVSGTVMAAMSDDSVGESFNLGFGSEFSILEAATQVLKHFGSGLSPRFEPAYGGDFPRTLCQNEKAKRALGWAPRVGFKKGLDLFLEWYGETRKTLKAQ
jgi:UDP-glucose 4-epimerase